MGDAHFLVRCFCAWFGRGLRIKQRHQERERGFRSLVLVDAIRMKSVFASACLGIVERHSEIVLAEEPIEYATGFNPPALLTRHLVCHKTSGDRGAGFNRLLIEARSLLAFAEDAVRAYGHKYLTVRPVLGIEKPLQRF